MGKEKIASIDNKRKEYTFYYEIVGIICLIIAIVTIARLGIIGLYAMLIFRLLFGDWYFLFVILLGLAGLYFLIVHRAMQIKNIRYLGIILILLTLLILSHFSMHNFVKNYDGNPFKLSVSLYLDYFKNARGEMMIGGGLFGGCLFYLFYYLFSSVGIIIVCVLLIFVGIVFLSKKTIVEFVRGIVNCFKKFFGKTKTFRFKIKNKIKVFDESYQQNSHKKVRILKMRNLEDPIQDLNLETTRCDELLYYFKKALDYMGIFYQKVDYIISYHISSFFIYTNQTINFEVFYVSINKFIKEKFLIRYDEINKIVIVEVNNLHPIALGFKEALKQVKIGQLTLTLGKDDRNNYINLDENLLIIGLPNRQYLEYLKDLIKYLYYQDAHKEHMVYLFDLHGDLAELANLVDKYEINCQNLEDYITNFENELEILNKEACSSITEYNKKHQSGKLPLPWFFINGLEVINDNSKYEERLNYLIRTSMNIGYVFVGGLTADRILSQTMMSGFGYKIILKNDFNFTERLLGLDYIKPIDSLVEGFLRYRDLTIRLSLLKEHLKNSKK